MDLENVKQEFAHFLQVFNVLSFLSYKLTKRLLPLLHALLHVVPPEGDGPGHQVAEGLRPGARRGGHRGQPGLSEDLDIGGLPPSSTAYRPSHYLTMSPIYNHPTWV